MTGFKYNLAKLVNLLLNIAFDLNNCLRDVDQKFIWLRKRNWKDQDLLQEHTIHPWPNDKHILDVSIGFTLHERLGPRQVYEEHRILFLFQTWGQLKLQPTFIRSRVIQIHLYSMQNWIWWWSGQWWSHAINF